MVVEKDELDRIKNWFPRIIFYSDSGELFVEILDESIGDLYRYLNLLNTVDFVKKEAGNICPLGPDHLLRKGVGGLFLIVDRADKNTPTIIIESQNALELVNALSELG
jgi:hypothetical protein